MRRRKDKIDLTLFPYMSVMAGLIAVLVLFMIGTLSTRTIGLEGQQTVQASERKKVERKKTGTGKADGPGAAGDGVDAKSYEQLSHEVDELTGLLAERLAIRRDIEKQMQEVADLVEAKKTELLSIPGSSGRQTGTRLAAPVPVKVIPAKGVKVNKTPVFVEVSAEGYTVYPEKKSFPPFAKKKDGLFGESEPASDLKRWLAELDKNRAKKYLVLLIQPNGAETFFDMLMYVKNKHQSMDIGWEPFAREWIFLAK